MQLSPMMKNIKLDLLETPPMSVLSYRLGDVATPRLGTSSVKLESADAAFVCPPDVFLYDGLSQHHGHAGAAPCGTVAPAAIFRDAAAAQQAVQAPEAEACGGAAPDAQSAADGGSGTTGRKRRRPAESDAGGQAAGGLGGSSGAQGGRRGSSGGGGLGAGDDDAEPPRSRRSTGQGEAGHSAGGRARRSAASLPPAEPVPSVPGGGSGAAEGEDGGSEGGQSSASWAGGGGGGGGSGSGPREKRAAQWDRAALRDTIVSHGTVVPPAAERLRGPPKKVRRGSGPLLEMVDFRLFPNVVEAVIDFSDLIYHYQCKDAEQVEDRVLFVSGHLNQQLRRIPRGEYAEHFLGKETRKTSIEYIPNKLKEAMRTHNDAVLDAYNRVLDAVEQAGFPRDRSKAYIND